MSEAETDKSVEVIFYFGEKDSFAKQPDILRVTAQIVTVIASFGFVIVALGWSYASAWFELWNIPFSVQDISTESLVEYAHIPLQSGPGLLVCISLLLGAFGIAFLVQKKHVPTIWATVPLLVLAPLSLWLGAPVLSVNAATKAYERLVLEDFEPLPIVEVHLNDTDGFAPYILDELRGENLCYRLVYMGEKYIWLARTRDRDPDPIIAMLPVENIQLLRAVARRGNCEGSFSSASDEKAEAG